MKPKLILNILSQLIVLVGMIGFLAGFLISSDIIDYDNELPISEVNNIAISSDGRIYVGLQFYGKVQCYDLEGNFIKNWAVYSGGGSFKMWISNNVVHVATARGSYYSKYDLDGNEIVTIQKDKYSTIEESKKVRDSATGIVYYVSKGLYPNIYKSVNGNDKKLTQRGLLLLIFQGPLPAWLILALGSISSSLLNSDKLKKRFKSRVFERASSDSSETSNDSIDSLFTRSVRYAIREDFAISKFSDTDILNVLKTDLLRWEKGFFKIGGSTLRYYNDDIKKYNKSSFNFNQLLSSDLNSIDNGTFTLINYRAKRNIVFTFSDRSVMIDLLKNSFKGILLMSAFLIFIYLKFKVPILPIIMILLFTFAVIILLSYLMPFLRFHSLIKRIIMKEELRINEL